MTYVTVGVGYYGLAVFLKPLQDEHGWSNGVVSGATGLYFVISGISSFMVGPIIDRRGPKAVHGRRHRRDRARHGADRLRRDDPPALRSSTRVMAVAYGMGASVAVTPMLARWFIDKRAKAISVVLDRRLVRRRHAGPARHGAGRQGRPGAGRPDPRRARRADRAARPCSAWSSWIPPVGLRPDGRTAERPAGEARLSTASQYRIWTRPEAARTAARSGPCSWASRMALATQTAVLIHQSSYLSEDGKLGSRSAAALARHRHHDRFDRRPPARRHVRRRLGQAAPHRAAVRRAGRGGAGLHVGVDSRSRSTWWR